MSTEERHCLECETILRGRLDQKFCSDQCRNSYHNRQNSDANKLIRNINNALRKNRRILAELNPNGKTRVRRDLLARKGFNFNYYTNIYQTKSGTTYYFCYDQGYIISDEKYFTLVKKEEYID